MTLKIVFIAFLVCLGLFFVYVSQRPDTFTYEKSGVINAPADKIFPYLNNFKNGREWSPYEQMDPEMKKTYSGPESGVGSAMEFVGKPDVGSGRLEILKEVPNSLVEVQLAMTKPMKATNVIQYKLTPEGSGTRFTWAMTGQVNFLGKMISTLIDCEKMMGSQFEKGIQNLKTVVESKK